MRFEGQGQDNFFRSKAPFQHKFPCGQHAYLAGENYTIADMACFPWTRSHKNQGIDLADFPNVQRWFDAISARPAVQRGVTVLADKRKPLHDDKAKELLFGKSQYQKR